MDRYGKLMTGKARVTGYLLLLAVLLRKWSPLQRLRSVFVASSARTITFRKLK